MSIIFKKENIRYIVIAVLVGLIVFIGLYVPSCTSRNKVNNSSTVDEVTPNEIVTTVETVSSNVVETTGVVTEIITEPFTEVEKSPQTGCSDEPTESEIEFVPSPERDDFK